MEKNITASQSLFTTFAFRLANLFTQLRYVSQRAVAPLQHYYSTVMEREVTPRQTLLLLQAQVSFVFGVFPASCPFVLRLLFAACLIGKLFQALFVTRLFEVELCPANYGIDKHGIWRKFPPVRSFYPEN